MATKKLSKEMLEVRARAYQACKDAYHEQERRTVDPTVKRTVAAALQHMLFRVIDEPYTPPPPTLYDAQTMAERMQIDFVRQLQGSLQHRKPLIESFIEVARKSRREPTELSSDTMTAVADMLELFLGMPDLTGIPLVPEAPVADPAAAPLKKPARKR
jgi:hypothetical protein